MYISEKQKKRLYAIARGDKRRFPAWSNEQIHDLLISLGIKSVNEIPYYRYANICKILDGMPHWSIQDKNQTCLLQT